MRHLATTIVCSALGCGGARPPDAPAAPQPPPQSPIDAPVAGTPPPDPIPAPKNPLDDIKPACRGAALAFDTEEKENECLIPNTLPHDLPASPGPDELQLAAVVEKPVAPGGTATVLVTLRNKTTEPMLLHVSRTCDDEPLFPISVLDTKKNRVDLIKHKNCDTHMFGCTRRVLRIVLEPGGSLLTRHRFAMKVTKILPDCGEAPAGSIRPGNYVMRVHTGLDPDVESSTSRKWANASLVVK